MSVARTMCLVVGWSEVLKNITAFCVEDAQHLSKMMSLHGVCVCVCVCVCVHVRACVCKKLPTFLQNQITQYKILTFTSMIDPSEL